MHYYYHFVRKTRRFSLIVLMNACLLALMYWAWKAYMVDDESERVVAITVGVIEATLLGVAAYLWVVNKQVEIRISPSEFYYHDPLFGSKEISVAVNDITALIQIQSATTRYTRNLLHVKDGSHYELMYQNYNVDRQAMFDALKKANNQIELPESIWAYEQTRPEWATELRKKMGADE